MATREEQDARTAVVDALGDPDVTVQQLAVSAVGSRAGDTVVGAIAHLLEASPSWSLKVRAAEALGRIGPHARHKSFPILAAAARADTYALVREAAIRALSDLDRAASLPILRELAEKDPESRVRSLAKELASRDARP